MSVTWPAKQHPVGKANRLLALSLSDSQSLTDAQYPSTWTPLNKSLLRRSGILHRTSRVRVFDARAGGWDHRCQGSSLGLTFGIPGLRRGRERARSTPGSTASCDSSLFRMPAREVPVAAGGLRRVPTYRGGQRPCTRGHSRGWSDMAAIRDEVGSLAALAQKGPGTARPHEASGTRGPRQPYPWFGPSFAWGLSSRHRLSSPEGWASLKFA